MKNCEVLVGLLSVFVASSVFANNGSQTAGDVFCEEHMSGDECEKVVDEKERVIAVLEESPSDGTIIGGEPYYVRLKAIDVDDGDSALGVEFGIDFSFERNAYGERGERFKDYGFSVYFNGTATQEEEDNPRDFLEAKLSFSLSSSPTYGFDEVSDSYARWLEVDERVKECREPQFLTDRECVKLLKQNYDAQFKPVGLTYYYDVGIDIGMEADQSLDAKNKTLGIFFSGTMQDLSNKTFLGAANIIPSIRIGVDTVKPSKETPRSMVGDETSYERLSAEFNISVPLVSLVEKPLMFSFGYRLYDEISASNLVKDANLDTYRLRTFILSQPTGLFFSYSSGRLPFGFEEERVVELGYQTHF